MEKADELLLFQIAEINPRLKQLYDEHLKLEKEVKKFERYAAYSPWAALHQTSLKKRKLRGMDSIMQILSEYRRHGSSSELAAP